ncbi:MAG: hypothetical protein RL011_2497 [Pseudomonadota bacterium]|jgi:glycosyltransferase involved in cell wall biosynthesis
MTVFELVVPAYNEEMNLPLVIKRCAESAVANGYNASNFQLIVVNNGSTDGSASVLREIKEGPLGQWFRVVNVHPNQGYGYGLNEGLKTTTAEFIGWSHADMQTDPTDAFRALKVLQNATKDGGTSGVLVKGERHGRNWKDAMVSRVFARFAALILGLRVSEINAQPKVFERQLIRNLTNPPFTFGFDLYALYRAAKAGYRFVGIPVQFPDRQYGLSKWSASLSSRRRTILGLIRYMWQLMLDEGRL